MPSPAPNTYPFDGTGTAASNKVSGEIQTLTVVNHRDYHFLIPQFAPFYAESLILKHRQNPTDPWVDLDEGTDYYCALSFIGATRATAKPVYGAISFNNLTLVGEIQLEYQTVGGEWTLGLTRLTELAANIIYNPRTTTWENIVVPPAHFPPLAHAWKMSDLVGQGEILDALAAIEQAILSLDPSGDLNNHLTNYSNPHKVSKSQVGLNRVNNYSTATIAEAIEGTSNELYVTPAGLKAFVDSLGLDKSLSFVSLQEVIEKIPVPKILTFDMFLEYMRLYHNDTGGGVSGNKPIISYPLESNTYVREQFFKCTTFADQTAGSINRTIALTGAGTTTIPAGVDSVRVVGRGGIGGQIINPYVVKTEVKSGLSTGQFTVPAGGNTVTIRARGGAGTSGRTKKFSLDPTTLTVTVPSVDNAGVVVSSVIINSVTPALNLDFGSAFSTNVNLSITFTYNSGSGPSAPQTLTTDLFVDVPVGYTGGGTTVNGQGWTNTNTDGSLSPDHETLVFNLTNQSYSPRLPRIQTGAPHNLDLNVDVQLSVKRLTDIVVTPGPDVTVSMGGAVRTYQGSTTTSSAALRTDTIPVLTTSATPIQYNSPAGTELEIIYEDYSSTGIWEVKRFYSTKITNPSTGSSNLVEDTVGNVIDLPVTATGDWLSTHSSVTLEPSTALPTAYVLQLVPALSNSTRRVFEYEYSLSNTQVKLQVTADLLVGGGGAVSGPDATVTILGTTHTFEGSADNNTIPVTQSDEVTLNIATATTVTYNCPNGTSVAITYRERTNNGGVSHQDTIWEISKDNSFSNSAIIEGTAIGKGSTFTMTQWKPTTNVLINNTDYFVRVRWVRSDSTMSDWSDIRQFRYSTGSVNPPRDTELTRFCKGMDQWGTFADGNGGSYERLILANSPSCGYMTLPPTSTPVLSLSDVVIQPNVSEISYGGTLVVATTVKYTVPGENYVADVYWKLTGQPDTAYEKYTGVQSYAFVGDPNVSTTVFNLNVPHNGMALGPCNVMVKVYKANTVNQIVSSNVESIVFGAVFQTTAPPTTTPAPSSDIQLVIASDGATPMPLSFAENISVSLSNGTPNTLYSVYIYETNSNDLNGAPGRTLGPVTVQTNSSGAGLSLLSVDNSSMTSGTVWSTRAKITINGVVTALSNIITRSFAAPVIPAKIVGSTSYSSNNSNISAPTTTSAGIGVGEVAIVTFTMTGFKPNTTYEKTITETAPDGSSNYANTDRYLMIVTDGNGNYSFTHPVQNTGSNTTIAGAYSYTLQVNEPGLAKTPTPGGNTPAQVVFIKNTVLRFSSNMPYPTGIMPADNEVLTIEILNGPPNQSIYMVARARYVSGASQGVDTQGFYDNPVTISTNSSGNGATTIPAGNHGSIIPYPSTWSRQIVIPSSGLTSEMQLVNFVQQAAQSQNVAVNFWASTTELRQYDELKRRITIQFSPYSQGTQFQIKFQQRDKNNGSSVWNDFVNPANPTTILYSGQNAMVEWSDWYNVTVPTTLVYQYRILLILNGVVVGTSNILEITRYAA